MKNLLKKRKVAIVGIIIILLLIPLIYYEYFILNTKSNEQKYPTVSDLWNDWDQTPYMGVVQCKFKSYSVGDNITIKDTVESLNITQLPDIEINKTNSKLSKALYKNVTYTLVGFKSGKGLYFIGNKEEDFPVGKKVKFTVTVKRYDFIPVFYELYGGEMIEEFYYTYHVMLLGELYKNARSNVSISLNIEQMNYEKVTINITDIIMIPYLPNSQPQDFDHCDGDSIRMVLYRNNSIIDEIIPNKKNVNGKNNHLSYEYMNRYYHDKIRIGDKIQVTDNLIGIQTYKIEIYWRHTYPIANYDSERIVKFLEFEM